MTDHAADAKAGSALYVAAVAAVAAGVFGAVYLISVVFAGLGLEPLRTLGALSLIGFIAAAPVAVGASLMVRCQACNLLVLPLVYDGKSLFSRNAPSAWTICKTAFAVAFHRRARCPHCGAQARV
jgi:hypothetical protein